MNYCPDLFHYCRRGSSTVRIGNTPLGGSNPIRVQSMTNTSTMDTAGSVEQCKRIIDAGADYVRLTAQGVREAENLELIRSGLRAQGYQTPLVADIHFNPKAADAAAQYVEKVRINPGNFVDPVKTFKHFEYTEEEYAKELQKIRERFVPFLHICKEHRTAVRIGVNHGSLSDRILSRYGDTPAGMVESCLEFLRICVEENFPDVVISIKASNTLVMVQTVRLLVVRMDVENMHFPLHLGVTEAGDGEDGRIKSAVGIGTLMIDGIGDTIRVSLSEDPELEIPVARQIVRLIQERSEHAHIQGKVFPGFDPFSFHRRKTVAVGPFGGGQVPVVIVDCSLKSFDFSAVALKPDFIYVGKDIRKHTEGIPQLCDAFIYAGQKDIYPVFSVDRISELEVCSASVRYLKLSYDDLSESLVQHMNQIPNLVLILYSQHVNRVAELRAGFHFLLNQGCHIPVVIAQSVSAKKVEEQQLIVGLDFGPLLLDGFGDGVLMFSPIDKNDVYISNPADDVSVLFGVLQATRLRISKTEYISCPSCGRTLYDLQKVIAKIKARTSHLKGLKIGIMGCIVNGPGEMADADYGYVGAGRGQVSLYKGQECVERFIPEEEAIDKLIELIRRNGDWQDPEI
ncbi:MAG: 4-hydroxy-3-methylbut-2-en-1-yl diphosphate synthase [Bacteroidales bacterium]|nr:4-hydroxy-3-methylbut-2-en-1-yl diphosphate synthase [Bacteroidales bacterium]